MLPVVNYGKISGGTPLAFFRRRAWRILPPLYAALLFGVAVKVISSHQSTGTWTLDSSALMTNIFLLQDVFLSHNIFDGALWSVAVEWRIYFLFPLLLAALSRWGRFPIVILTGILVVPISWIVTNYYPQYAMACPWYLLLFVLGILSSELSTPGACVPTRLWQFFTLLFVVLSAVALRNFPVGIKNLFGSHMYIVDILVGAAAASLIGTLRGYDRGKRALEWPLLSAIGKRSYSLYLVHLPTIILCSTLSAWILGNSTSVNRTILQMMLTCTMIPLVTYTLYKYVEAPSAKMR